KEQGPDDQAEGADGNLDADKDRPESRPVSSGSRSPWVSPHGVLRIGLARTPCRENAKEHAVNEHDPQGEQQDAEIKTDFIKPWQIAGSVGENQANSPKSSDQTDRA